MMRIIERPVLVTAEDGRLTVVGVRRVGRGGRWAFWGWVLLATVALLVLSDPHRWRLDAGFWDYMLPLTGGVVGVSLVRQGKAAQAEVAQPLLRISADRNQVATLGEDGKVQAHLSTDALTHVVFGIVDVPHASRRDVSLEACAVYLACEDGTPVPVIEACEDKPSAFRLAKALSTALNLPIIELGRGMGA
jgi:hypothetical protein